MFVVVWSETKRDGRLREKYAYVFAKKPIAVCVAGSEDNPGSILQRGIKLNEVL